MPFDKELGEVAERFVQFVHRQAGAPVIVCDERGLIAHATVRSRVGNSHPGAVKILAGEADEVLVTAEMEAADPRMKQGCNSPIRLGNAVAGTFGVAGPLEVARPLAHVAAGVLGGWIREVEQRRHLRTAADEVMSGVKLLGARVEAAAAESRGIEERMKAVVAEATERAARTDEVLGTVQGVAAQSRILAINGSVESSRAGDAGRAFAVVAREMLVLAEDAKSTAGRLQAALRGVREALARHAAALEGAGRAGREQLEAMTELAEMVASIRDRITGIAASFEDHRGRGREVHLDARFWEDAQRFMEFVARETGRQVIVCDGEARIVRASDPKRIGSVHAGAQRILRGEVEEASVTAEEAARNDKVKEGCSYPITVGGRRVGTFGITGPLAITRPLARVAANVIATRVRELESREVLEEAAGVVLAGVDKLSRQTHGAADAARQRAADMAQASRDLEEQLAETEALAEGVQQLSQQSRIIAINGSVEAASAGGQFAFANVARDMLKLADDTNRAGKEIALALRTIRGAVAALLAAAALQEQAGQSRTEAADAVLASVSGLETMLHSLIAAFGRDGL